MRTKGALLWGRGETWSVEEIELGEPRTGEALVRLAASGLCHSDEHLVTGDDPIDFPVLGGHEGAGVVVRVGPGVTALREGDHVVTSFVPACGTCPPCANGRQNLCDLGAHLLTGRAISDGTARVTARGRDVIPMCLLGTFAPYITCHEASLIKIDPSIPLEHAALVACGVTTGWGSATTAAEVRPGDTVVVMGAGGVGMNAVQGAAAAGAQHVVVVEPVAAKRDWSLTFGATHACAAVEEAAELLDHLTAGRLAVAVIVCIGTVRGEHIRQALALTGKGGRVVVTGMASAADRSVDLSLFELTLLQKEVRGALFGGVSPRAEIPRLLARYQHGGLNLGDLVSRTYRLEEINAGYQDMRDGKNIRGLISYVEADY